MTGDRRSMPTSMPWNGAIAMSRRNPVSEATSWPSTASARSQTLLPGHVMRSSSSWVPGSTTGPRTSARCRSRCLRPPARCHRGTSVATALVAVSDEHALVARCHRDRCGDGRPPSMTSCAGAEDHGSVVALCPGGHWQEPVAGALVEREDLVRPRAGVPRLAQLGQQLGVRLGQVTCLRGVRHCGRRAPSAPR